VVMYGERALFIKSKSVNLYDNNIVAHVILDPSKKASDIQNILRQSNAEGFSSEELDEKMKLAGYFILISSKSIERQEILPTYYTRQSIEQIFGFAKSSNNILPLRVHNQETIRGYMMLVFLSVILFVIMRQKLAGKYTVEQAMLILRGLKAKVFDKEILVLEANKRSKTIFSALGIIVPTSLGV
jgi:transposase